MTYTFTFHVVVEREAHQWRAYCPAFESYEASTGGQTREEALAHMPTPYGCPFCLALFRPKQTPEKRAGYL